MDTGTWMRRGAALVLAAGLAGGGSALAQGMAGPPAATKAGPAGYGPGMMVRAHQGPYGPGMSSRYGGGHGPGAWGMAPSYMGWGMGPGMMNGCGGYARYGMGPRMMSGYGMGPGMMGAWGMGPEMMPGHGGFAGMHGFLGGWGGHALGLSAEQEQKIADIHERTFKAAWPLMGQLREHYFDFARLSAAAEPDRVAIDKAYEQISALKQKLLDLRLQARKDVYEVLTPAQRKQLAALHRGYWY